MSPPRLSRALMDRAGRRSAQHRDACGRVADSNQALPSGRRPCATATLRTTPGFIIVRREQVLASQRSCRRRVSQRGLFYLFLAYRDCPGLVLVSRLCEGNAANRERAWHPATRATLPAASSPGRSPASACSNAHPQSRFRAIQSSIIVLLLERAVARSPLPDP